MEVSGEWGLDGESVGRKGVVKYGAASQMKGLVGGPEKMAVIEKVLQKVEKL